MVVVAAGALVTPQLLQLSGLDRLGTPSSQLIGYTLGTHTARMVRGVFDEVMDAHIVYPITAHCKDFADDEDGGFVVEATTILDPIALASNLVDDEFAPLCGSPLVGSMDSYPHMAGLFMMTNDSNVGVVKATGDQAGEFEVTMPDADERRLDDAHAFCVEVLRAAGPARTVSTGYLTSHVQGSVRMGSDLQRSCCDANQELWDVAGLYVGDSSAIPRTLTFNPSLTIMAFAERLAQHIDTDAAGRLRRPARRLSRLAGPATGSSGCSGCSDEDIERQKRRDDGVRYVDDLADPQIHGHAAHHVGLLPGEPALCQVLDHVDQGVTRCRCRVLRQAAADVVDRQPGGHEVLPSARAGRGRPIPVDEPGLRDVLAPRAAAVQSDAQPHVRAHLDARPHTSPSPCAKWASPTETARRRRTPAGISGRRDPTA